MATTSEAPLVSVIVPSYQRPKKLEKAIQSVLGQTFDDFELMVVDDGSTPPLESTVSQFEDSRIQYVRLEENSGANVARNTGIERSRGELLAFLDDDDWWVPTKLEKQVEIAREVESAGVVYTGLEWIDESGESIRTHTQDVSGDLLHHLLKGGDMPPFSCWLVRRSAVSRAGNPNPELPILQDREWSYRLAQHTCFEGVPEPLVKKLTGHDKKIGGDFEALHDVTIPYMLNEYMGVAREEGLDVRLPFKSHMIYKRGDAALSDKRYNLARKYYFISLLYWPFRLRGFAKFLASIGGNRSHWAARHLRQYLRKWGFSV